MKNIISSIIAVLIFGQTAMAQCNMDRHNSNAYDGWVSCQMTPNPNPANGTTHWILYDLGEIKSLYTSQFWNINHPNHLDWGIRTIRIEHSLDNINWTLFGDFTIQQGSGQQVYEGEEGPDFEALSTRYLLLTILDTYGDNSCAGFGELKIFTENSLCLSLLSLSGIINNATYRAADTITSIGIIPQGGNVSCKAGQIIVMEAGFSVENNANFSAEIENCGGD